MRHCLSDPAVMSRPRLALAPARSVGGCREGEGPVHVRQAAQLRPTQARDSLHPAESLFDPLADALACSIARMPCRPAVNRRATAARVPRLRALGIRDRLIAPRSPWQNAYVERMIGSARRECIDQVIVFGETHLRRLMTMYASYYNEACTRLSLGKDSPTTRPITRFGRIIAEPMVGDLHHRYARI